MTKQTPQERFEKRIKTLLTEPKPEPRFELWQQLKYCLGDGIKSGCIVGYYWVSVACAFHTSDEPGWVYVLQEDWAHNMLDEELLIEAVEAVKS